MKIDYDSNIKNEREWKVGDVIRDTDSFFYLVSEVTSDNEISYTLIDLGNGTSLGWANTINELQQDYYNKGDEILNGTFKYTEDGK